MSLIPTGHGLPVLYSFRRCPYAMRARLAIKVAGLAVVQREVLLGNKPAELLALSPKGTVPVLLLPNGEVLDESLDIMRWALAFTTRKGGCGRTSAKRCSPGPFATTARSNKPWTAPNMPPVRPKLLCRPGATKPWR